MRFDESGNEDSEELFRTDLVEAMDKFAEKVHRKHEFTDDGIKIEPFNLK